TFTTLRAKLADRRSDALVCGFTSSHPGEGRSTWINLLQRAAADQGYRVSTIFAGSPAHALQVSSSPPGGAAVTVSSENTVAEQSLVAQSSLSAARTTPTYSIWGSNGRARWRELVAEWTSTEQLVVLAELPPASTPEAVLLAERFPNLIWLCGTGTTQDT